MARRRIGLWAPLAAYMALIFYLSGLPGGRAPLLVWDKVLHGVCYAGLMLLALRAFHGGLGVLRPAPAAAAFAFTVLYGVTDEVHQSFVPGRDVSLGDVAADGVGAAASVVLLAALRRPRAASRGAGPGPEAV